MSFGNERTGHHRPSIMVALLAAIVFQIPPQRVSLVSRGATIASILKEATKQTGVAMDAIPETRNEILVVSVSNAPLSEFQEHLADVIGARWRKSGGVMRLVRPLDLERSQIKAERKLRIEEVRQGVENLTKKVSEQPPFDEKAANEVARKLDEINTKYKGHTGDSPGLEAVIALEPTTPGGRLSIAAVATLTPEEVADVPPGGRIVYSTNPTAMQRPMPSNFNAAIQRYQKEQHLYVEALKKFPVGQTEESNNPHNPLEGSEISSVMMITERSPYNPNLTVNIHLVGADGSYIGGTRSLLDLGESSNPSPPLAEGKVPLCPRSTKFMEASAQLQKGKSFLEDGELLAELTHPETNDPLSYVVADGLFALGSNQNLIASVPDIGFVEVAFNGAADAKNLDRKKFSQWLTDKCNVKQMGNWMLATPKRMVETRNLRVDRSVLGPFIRNSLDSGGISIEPLAAFVSQMPPSYMETIAPMLAFFVLPDLNAAVSDRTIELLRVLGRLAPDQRAALDSGKPLTAQNLPSESIADLNHLIYRADPPIGYVSRGNGSAPAGRYQPSTKDEVTIAMPSGIPSNATITTNNVAEDAVIIDGGGSAINYNPLNAYNVAWTLVRAEKADPSDKREHIKIDKYRFGHIRKLLIHLELTSSLQVEGSITETNFSRKAASVPFDQLPDAFRKSVETQIARLRTTPGFGEKPGARKVPPL